MGHWVPRPLHTRPSVKNTPIVSSQDLRSGGTECSPLPELVQSREWLSPQIGRFPHASQSWSCSLSYVHGPLQFAKHSLGQRQKAPCAESGPELRLSRVAMGALRHLQMSKGPDKVCTLPRILRITRGSPWAQDVPVFPRLPLRHRDPALGPRGSSRMQTLRGPPSTLGAPWSKMKRAGGKEGVLSCQRSHSGLSSLCTGHCVSVTALSPTWRVGPSLLPRGTPSLP